MTAATADATTQRRGEIGSRLRNPVLVVLFAAIFAAVVVVALLVVKVRAPAEARPPCAVGRPCPLPPGMPRVRRGTVWRNDYGFSIEYSSVWFPSERSRTRLELNLQDATMIVTGSRSSDYRRLYDRQVASLTRRYNLAKTHDPTRIVLNPNVGYQPGYGGDYCGDQRTTQGGARPLDVIALAATKDGISAFVALLSPDCHKTANDLRSPIGAPELAAADAVLNTFRWPSERR